MAKYLDNNGLLYFWNKVKTHVTNAITGKADNITYADNKLSLKSGANTLSEVTITSSSGATGTTNYVDLINKPSINNVSLNGNKTLTELGINNFTKVSQLTNDSNFQNNTQVTSAINSAIAGVTQFNYSIVSVLPSTGVKGTIYLVSETGSTGTNVYKEYIWLDTKFEQLGSKEIDLSGYVKNADLVAITNGEIDAII